MVLVAPPFRAAHAGLKPGAITETARTKLTRICDALYLRAGDWVVRGDVAAGLPRLIANDFKDPLRHKATSTPFLISLLEKAARDQIMTLAVLIASGKVISNPRRGFL